MSSAVLKSSTKWTVKMCDVTRENFDEIYDEIINNLRSASFLSIDCEFSGLFEKGIECNLFDTPKARFEKLQHSFTNFTIIQFGLSTFKCERPTSVIDNTAFTVSTYNFYLKPATGFGNEKCIFQPGSVEFLCKNRFDFNKLFYKGINYLNRYTESAVLSMIEEGNIFNENDGETIQKYCSEVSMWIGGATEGCEMFLNLKDKTRTFVCLVHQEVRRRFQNVWTYFEEEKVVKIKKIKNSEKVLLSSGGEESLKEKLFDSILGFSKIMKEMEKLQKPIVGHNVLLDLIMIYKQFYNPSPVSYKEFKKAISGIFPTVFDTKYMSFALRGFLSRERSWNTNILQDLYEYLKHGKGSTLVIFSPTIKHQNGEFIKENHFHDAGFDSYCTGFCFLKMAHIFSLKDEKENTFQLTTMQTSSAWLLGAVAPMKNKVNMTRGQVKYIVLDGGDPGSSLPGFLFLESKTSRPLNISQVRDILAKYASVDIQPLTKHKALMAVSSRKQAKEILQRLKHEEIKVTKYNFLRHSNLGKTIVSVTLIASIVLTAVFASRGWKRM